MSSTTIVKKTVRRVVDGDGNVSESVSTTQSGSSSSSNYSVYRGMSPTTQSHLENRVRELEYALEQERSEHTRTHSEVTTIRKQIEVLAQKLEDAENESSSQTDVARRRDQELLKAKKDNELLTLQHEAAQVSLKKRFQDQIDELVEQLEKLNKAKSKLEKEKQQITVENEGLYIQVEEIRKAKAHVEAKVQTLEENLEKLRLQIDVLTRSNQELNVVRSQLVQENSNIHHQLQEIESKYDSLNQIKIQVQQKLDATLKKLDEEKRVYIQLESQFSSLKVEFEQLNSLSDQTSDEVLKLRAQLPILIADNQALKVRYEKDIAFRIEEFEDLRRSSSSRIQDLENNLEQARVKVTRLEKEKHKLTITIEEITIELESTKLSLNDYITQLKQSETSNTIIRKQINELNSQVQSGSDVLTRYQSELVLAKQTISDQQMKIDSFTKENQKLRDSVHELEITVKEVTRLQEELLTVRSQLRSERDEFQSKLLEANDKSDALQLKIEAISNEFNQFKVGADNAVHSKNEEIENIRKGSKRTIDELHIQVTELESRMIVENSRWKKKLDNELAEFQLQIDLLNKDNAELTKINKNLAIKLKDAETSLEQERRTVDKLSENSTIVERKLVSLQTELEELQILLTSAERARKNAESEKTTSKTYIMEINQTIQTLTIEKRQLESAFAVRQRELDDAVNDKNAAEETVKRLSLELNNSNDQLRREQSNLTNIETKNKQLEIKIREFVRQIELMESTKENKKGLVKLQSRITELEKELEAGKRYERDLSAELKKLQRLLAEQKLAVEGERRQAVEFRNTADTLELKITALKRQLQESDDMLSITLGKYRRSQQLLEEAERRADRVIGVVNHKTTSISADNVSKSYARGRSYSVTRETSKIRSSNY